MTTFRGMIPLSTADSRYAQGYRYAVATASVPLELDASSPSTLVFLTGANPITDNTVPNEAAFGGVLSTNAGMTVTDGVYHNGVASQLGLTGNYSPTVAWKPETNDLYVRMTMFMQDPTTVFQVFQNLTSTDQNEVRIVQSGANYNWRVIAGGEQISSTPSTTHPVPVGSDFVYEYLWTAATKTGVIKIDGAVAFTAVFTTLGTGSTLSSVQLATSFSGGAGSFRVDDITVFLGSAGGLRDALNTAAGGAVTGEVTLDSVVYTAARTLAEGDAESLVIGTATPGSAHTATFEPVIRGRTDGFRICRFDAALTPTGAPGPLDFRFVHFGLVGDVFVVGDSEDIDDGVLTGPGGLQARYYSGRDFVGLPVAEPVENVDLQRSESVAGVNMSNFSARWVGYIRPPETGSYRFRYTSDGRGRVILGDNTYIDAWGGNARRVVTGPAKALVLDEDVFIRVDVENTSLGHEAVLEWETPSTPGVFAVVPASVMFYGANVTISPQRQDGASHYVQSVNRYLEA